MGKVRRLVAAQVLSRPAVKHPSPRSFTHIEELAFATGRTHDVTMAAELGIAVLDHNIVLEERLAHDAVATVLDISGLSDGFT